jgi:pilus assembly protein Flp/PilA
MIKFLKSLLQKEEGQGLVEYALIISLVSVALIVGLGLLAGGIGSAFTSVIASL